MNSLPIIPETAPFTLEQRAWLNGYLAGLFSRAAAPDLPAAKTSSSATEPLIPLTILYGSQTGTAESLAKKAAKDAGRRGFAAMALDMAQTDVSRLVAEKNVLVIVSTYGDGEPPDSAKALHAALGNEDAPSMPQMRFSVCSLGDTNYAQFCQCGKDFDARLEKRRAIRITPRVDCDLDYEAPFARWLDTALSALSGITPETSQAAVAIASPATEAIGAQTLPVYSRKHPFPSRVLTSRMLNAPGSAKQVHHIEFDLASSGIAYQAGDALGVIPQNCPELVDDILAALGCDGEEAVVTPSGEGTSLRRALIEYCDLGKPSAELLRLYPGCHEPHHVIDVLLGAQTDRRIRPEEFVRTLRKLQPRLYSISSSPKAHPGQVHLTVGAVRYDAQSRCRKGVCSTFLTERVKPGESHAGIFVHANPSFRPPPADTDAIMIGPGTGIAPFRAFLQERRSIGGRGRNWLFFGDQRSATDFLYREEMTELHANGLLTRLDLAFSRDQTEKIYVQHRMLECEKELWAWLEAGAHVYVCGDASRMAKDVDATLHAVVERAGGRSTETAAAYIQSLRSEKRYLRDVY